MTKGPSSAAGRRCAHDVDMAPDFCTGIHSSVSRLPFDFWRRLKARQKDATNFARENTALVNAEWWQKLRILKTEELKRSLGVTHELVLLQIDRQKSRLKVMQNCILELLYLL